MSVLIVGKTHLRDGACVGGLDLSTGQSVRLVPTDRHHHPGDTSYEVGQLWEMRLRKLRYLTPPHVEDMYIDQATYIGQADNIVDLILEKAIPWYGAPERLFDGYVRMTHNGAAYICRRIGIPWCSTGYWIADQHLTYLNQRGHVRYEYTSRDSVTWAIPYVGYAPPAQVIPAGTVVRVSLARWWRPDDRPDKEERCYVQISGWFLLPSPR